MGFEPDFAPKITTVLGHLHGKVQAGFAGGHMQFQNKGLPSRSFGIILADSFGICQGMVTLNVLDGALSTPEASTLFTTYL